jgi:mono/diheme cytochrome c family protein
VRRAVLLIVLAGCRSRGPFSEPLALAGGRSVTAEELNDGHEAYTLYCYACHGAHGDGRGPSSPGMRPPPRDFTLGTFKFAGVAVPGLPHDEDLMALVHNGLDGTPMLPWDVGERERHAIVQYIKTFSSRWKEEEPGDKVMPEGPDPWFGPGKEEEGLKLGRRLYHLAGAQMDPKTGRPIQVYAGCNACHPSYVPREELAAMGLEVLGKPPELRPDLYSPAADKPSDFLIDGHRLLAMPTDFLFQRVKNGTSLVSLYRTIASGIGGTAMPTWKGVLTDGDLWAIAHYVKSLADVRGTSEAFAISARLATGR